MVIPTPPHPPGGSLEQEPWPDREIIRRGFAFHTNRQDLDVPAAPSVKYHLRTGLTEMHLRLVIAVEGVTRFRLFEAPTITDDGTVLPIFNRRRDSIITPETQVWHSPTVSANGTVISRWIVQGKHRFDSEWILLPNTDYFMDLLNRGGQDSDLSMEFSFYEAAL